MNKFHQLSHDELHTLATALGNTITRLYERKDDAIKLNATELAAYLNRCINDAAELLAECETAFNDDWDSRMLDHLMIISRGINEEMVD